MKHRLHALEARGWRAWSWTSGSVAAGILLFAALAGLSTAGVAQIQVETLANPPSDVPFDLQPLRQKLQDATEIFYSANQPDAIPLLGDLIAELGEQPADDDAGQALRDLLAEALFLRAVAWKNLAEETAAAEDLRRLLQLEPDFRADPVQTSPVLLRALEEARAETVGRLRIEADPADLKLSIDGRGLAFEGELFLTAGLHRLSAGRPGHEEVEREIEIGAGELQVVSLVLERTSAVLAVTTEPDGVEVVMQDRIVGRTSIEPAEPHAAEAAAGSSLEGPAPLAELLVDGLQPGRHELELRKDGYRSRRLEVEVESLSDYDLEPVILEPTEGTLLLTGLPRGASLSIDDRPAGSAEGSSIQLALAAGLHRIAAVLRPVGAFHQTVDLADRETLEVAVEIRPVVALVGVLSGLESANSRLARELRTTFEASGRWTIHDCEGAAAPVLSEYRVDADQLRRVAGNGRALSALDSWEPFLESLDGACGGSLYLLAVLSDDIYATWADLWLWPAGQPAAVAERVRIGLEPSDNGLADLAEMVSRPLRLESAWVGARFLDSAAASGPVVLEVTADGPAAEAGLAVGDEVRAASGEVVESCRELEEILTGLTPGSDLELETTRAGEARRSTIRAGASPVVLSPSDPEILGAVVAAHLAVEASRPTPSAPTWLLRLNQATALMRLDAWREAVLTLRETTIASDQGLDQSMADYLLGWALLGADPNAYEDRARGAFGRAAASPDGRLFHRDGIHLQPRAEVRSEPAKTP